MARKAIQDVLREHTPQWMAIGGVVGTAIGELEGRPCIVVFVAEGSAELGRKIPADVEGYRVVVEETGEFRAL
jgi:hypothetical protein